MYYVYAHMKPDNTVFYIGKGTKTRAWSSHGRNTRWQRTVAKHGYSVCVLMDALSQVQAIEEEARVIAHFKPFGHLVNVLDRGDISPSSNPDVAAKISAAASKWQRGRTLSQEHRANVAKNSAWKGRKRPEHSVFMKAKATWIGDRNPFYGSGAQQAGVKNHASVKIVGEHEVHGSKIWDTMTAAARDLGVTLAAISQALKKQQQSKGWLFRRVL